MAENDELGKRVDDHEGRIRDLEEKSIRNDMLTESCVKALDKLDTTMDKVINTMGEMSISMVKMQEGITKIDSNIKENDDSIKALADKVDSIEEKGKIDWQQWVKDNFTKLIIFFILLCLAFPQVAEIFTKIFG